LPGRFDSKLLARVPAGRVFGRVAIVAALALLCGPVPGAGDPESELGELRARIRAIQADIDADLANRDSAGARLRDAERAAAAAVSQLEKVRAEIALNRAQAAALRVDRDRLRESLGDYREQLGAQVRGAYMSGQQNRLRLLLNQEDPVRLGRMMAWYGYAADARARQVDETVARLAELVGVEAALRDRETALETLAARQADEAARLESARAERAAALAALERRLAERGDEKLRLETEAAALEDLIGELRKALADLPDPRREPFADQKGKLAWPVGGQLLRDYGQPRGGGMTWRGVLVAAPRGAEVRAVYHGRVAYADWLPGMGMLVIVDHGDGYLSLYGHNEALYKSVGEWVAPGEVLAAAGDSGGGPQTALYFEIRKGTRPENPHRWFGHRLSSS
jgi:septal ring factor EnvC (AmiA/AmiB activator)